MSITIKRQNEKRIASAFTHRLADIPNGVTVASAELTQSVMYEGTPIGVDENGLYHVVKSAKVVAAADNAATTITVAKGHNLKVGENVFAVKGGKCYAITSIVTDSENEGYDDVTVATTLGVALKIGDVIYVGGESGASKGAFKYEPVAVVGENYDVEFLSNTTVNAWTIAQLIEARVEVALGAVLKSAMTTVKFI